ncbi:MULTISPECIES: PrgI family protein [Streptococcus]|uniref:PrgI family protein n=1 Tax=Streptococcus dysgalactiae subsp. equisimilis TaxID=119602 RepID=A0A9X8XGR4_STREQ|nr:MULTISPECIES: PrgI family protein [Streptococcus]OHX27582.1 type III secretion system protein PrgI [Streptococcus iniae]HEL0702689.1 PrgI family protein [Streptococcus equi subsp. zooepidemicus]HEP3126439.1 PrgI family protein [Streptococcus pyogenes]EPT37494.1 PrgI family protein [Streptococcus agalactiae FSL S3-501]KAF1205842.1 PrgI family protein [Streptococcus agalactiae]
MTRLGSEFLKALDSYERPFLGYMTLRQWILLFGIGLTVLVTSVLFWFKTPNIILYGVSLLVLAPFVIFGCHIDEKIKDELRFFLTKQERTYQTNFDRKETTQNDFIRPKENPETL